MNKMTNFTEVPSIEKAKIINIEPYDIFSTELLFWLDNNTNVKHVLKYTNENDYHIFFKTEDEYNRLNEFLYKRLKKAA